MKKFVLKSLLSLLVLMSFKTVTFATKFANIEYDVPIDYSKIDKNALAE